MVGTLYKQKGAFNVEMGYLTVLHVNLGICMPGILIRFTTNKYLTAGEGGGLEENVG
jgi:hypothetical protein